MSLSLTSKLKNIINQIEKYPFDSMDIDIALPYSLKSKINLKFIELANKEKNGNEIVHSEINSNRNEDTIKKILYKLQSIGVTYDNSKETVEKCIMYSLEYLIQNYPVHLIWKPVNLGVSHPNNEIKEIDRKVRLTRFEFISPWKEIHYGVENSLFFWSGQNWIITPMGKVFKSLSIPTGTVFLLMLENYLNVPERNSPFNINPWHMSKEFLAKFIDYENIEIDIGDGTYKLMDLDPNMEYLNRLDDFQLTNTSDHTLDKRGESPDEVGGIPIMYIADDFYCTNLTAYGKEIINRVLDESPNILRAMIENLITFELSGSEYFEVNDFRIYDRLLELSLRNDEITGDQKLIIEEICKALKEGKDDISIFRSLPPTIEKILKNILIEYSLVDRSDSRITLGPIINLFEKQISEGTPILKFDTIQYLKSIDRNSIMHGSITPSGELKNTLINLMLNVLIKIYEEYEIEK